MKKYLFLLLSFFVITAFAFDNGKWTGYIGDSHCGASGNGADHASCAKKCVKEGYKPVFVVGDKVYAIKNPDIISKYIGDKVTVEGTLTNDTLSIAKISE